MKKFKYLSTIILIVLLPLLANSQTKDNGKILLTGSRFTYPLLEKWISEFKKSYPEVEVRILPRRTFGDDSANLIINAHKLLPEEVKEGYEFININRYVLLPISNSNNPLNEKLLKKGLKEEDVKSLFFENEIYEGEDKKNEKNGLYAYGFYPGGKSMCSYCFCNTLWV